MLVTLHEGCKLCALVGREPDIWWEVHRRVFEEHVHYQKVMRWLNSLLEVKNKINTTVSPFPLLNPQNFHYHFVKFKHVANLDEARTVCQEGFLMHGRRIHKSIPPLQRPPAMQRGERSGIMVVPTDFQRMKALIAAADTRLHALNAQMSKKEAEGGDDCVIDIQQVALFQKLVSELLKLQKEASKVEASSKVAGAALRDAVGMIVEGAMDKVDSTATEVHGLLTRELPGSRLPDQISGLLRSSVGNWMKQAIPQVLENVEGKYGIR